MRLFCTVNGPVDPYIALSVLIAFGTWCYMFLSHLLCVWLCEGWVTGLPGKEHASCMRFGGGETGWRRGQGFWWSVLEDSVQWSVSLVPCKMLKSLRWREDMALNSCVCVYMPRERKPAQCIQFPTGVRTQPQPSSQRWLLPAWQCLWEKLPFPWFPSFGILENILLKLLFLWSVTFIMALLFCAVFPSLWERELS